jgi:lysozyme
MQRRIVSKSKYTLLGTVVSLAVLVTAQFEGKSNTAYLDMVEVPTICYGTTRRVRLSDVRTDTECLAFLRTEVDRIDALLSKEVSTPLQDNERAAILSWIYNVGDGNFLHSTLLHELKAGNVPAACNQLPKWVYARGNRIPGLIKRRAQERLLCLGVTDVVSQ